MVKVNACACANCFDAITVEIQNQRASGCCCNAEFCLHCSNQSFITTGQKIAFSYQSKQNLLCN